jgi:hypothetical protein
MTDQPRTSVMIAAILLACAAVTAITWAGLSLVTGSATARHPAPSPTIHAYLMPVQFSAGQASAAVAPQPGHHPRLKPAPEPAPQLGPHIILPAHPAKH